MHHSPRELQRQKPHGFTLFHHFNPPLPPFPTPVPQTTTYPFLYLIRCFLTFNAISSFFFLCIWFVIALGILHASLFSLHHASQIAHNVAGGTFGHSLYGLEMNHTQLWVVDVGQVVAGGEPVLVVVGGWVLVQSLVNHRRRRMLHLTFHFQLLLTRPVGIGRFLNHWQFLWRHDFELGLVTVFRQVLLDDTSLHVLLRDTVRNLGVQVVGVGFLALRPEIRPLPGPTVLRVVALLTQLQQHAFQ